MSAITPSTYVVTKTRGDQTTFTAMNTKTEIVEFDIRPSMMTLICNQPVSIVAFDLKAGYNILTGQETVQRMVSNMLFYHSFLEEQKVILRKSL